MKIMPITNYGGLQSQLIKAYEPQTTPIETNDSVSFRAKSVKQKNIGTGIKFFRTVAAAIAGLAGMQVIETPEAKVLAPPKKVPTLPDDIQESKNMLKKRFFLSDLKDSVDRSFYKNASMAQRLFNKKFIGGYGQYVHCYSPIEVEAIIDYKLIDSTLSSKLEQVLANTAQFGDLYKREQIDYIAKKIQEEPEIVKKLQSESSPITYGYLRAYDIDPKNAKKIHKIKKGAKKTTRYDGDDVLRLIPLLKKYPAAVNSLIHNKDFVFSVSAIEKIAPNYKAKKGLIKNGDLSALGLHLFERLNDSENDYRFII